MIDGEDDLRAQLSAAMDGEADSTAVELPTEIAPPVDETPAQTAERVRDEQGRFAAKPAAEQQAKPADAAQPKPGEEQAQSETQQPAVADAPRPPPGWSVASKQAFDALPPSVKADIAKRETEINQGFAELREYRDLRPYKDMAAQHGTTIRGALDNYIAAEKLLTEKPREGIVYLAQRYGVDLRSFGVQTTGQQPHQTRAAGQPGLQPLAQAIAPLAQKVVALERVIGQQQAQQLEGRKAELGSQIEAFGANPANKWFDNVLPDMVRIMRSAPGTPLQKAYDDACYMNAEVREALIKERITTEAKSARQRAEQAASAARRSAGGITGSPLPGASANGSEPGGTLRAQLVEAFDAGRV